MGAPSPRIFLFPHPLQICHKGVTPVKHQNPSITVERTRELPPRACPCPFCTCRDQLVPDLRPKNCPFILYQGFCHGSPIARPPPLPSGGSNAPPSPPSCASHFPLHPAPTSDSALHTSLGWRPPTEMCNQNAPIGMCTYSAPTVHIPMSYFAPIGWGPMVHKECSHCAPWCTGCGPMVHQMCACGAGTVYHCVSCRGECAPTVPSCRMAHGT